MQCTMDEFKAVVLPGLRAENQTPEALQDAVRGFCKENEVTDGEGNALDVETFVAGMGALTPPTEDPAKPTEPGAAGVPGSLNAADVADIVTKTMKAMTPEKKGKIVHPEKIDNPGEVKAVKFVIPAEAKGWKAKRVRKDAPLTEDPEMFAYRFGTWIAACNGSQWATKRCQELGISTKAQSESVNTAAGVLVPPEFDSTIIDLRETYGVARKNLKTVPMARDTKSVPRRDSGIIAYFVGEAQTIAESQKAWSQVNLIAKKLGAMTRYSNEVDEDAIINIGDDLAGEIAWAFAKKEDQCAFTGDGTSTYGGIVGLSSAFANLDGTAANIAGMVVSASALMNGVLQSEVMAAVGRLPRYAYTPNTKWYMSAGVWGGVFMRLALAQGGSTAYEAMNPLQLKYNGFPVEIVQVMPQVAASTTIFAYFGDLSLAAMIGDRRQTTLNFSDSAMNAFEQDQMVIRGIERMDINVHDVGNTSATVASRVPGPIVALRWA